ncbi:hypothetical protein SeLEV6574_g03821 [Synchytrium endobioticum]|uniref:Pre-mRNA-splicing factor CWC26 n=1 Tax=Synchytrium endobioticum TaxID=286115 RepID=A0A507D2P7_9FUNG|nr:hypothetical protein SeLEV6574_g03821 [Synchytrium endobioticum]
MSNLQAYLAKKYLSAPPSAAAPSSNAVQKQRKKKLRQPARASTTVVDEDVDGWQRSSYTSRRKLGCADDHDDDDTSPLVVEDGSAVAASAFKSSNWVTINNGNEIDQEESAAMKVAAEEGLIVNDDGDPNALVSTSDDDARPRKRRRRPDSDDDHHHRPPRRPSGSVSPEPHRTRRRHSSTPPPASTNVVRMADGTAAGLQTGASVRADLDRTKREQDSVLSRIANQGGRDAETIYRDKTGKKVDIAAERAELLAQRRKREAEEEKQMEWGKGLVQSREKETSFKRIEMERSAPLAVYKDDVEYNNVLKNRDRWGDPMAGLVKKPANKKEYPKYKGPWPPNRFNIPPGHRWDGVDRGNGFESKMFLSKNTKVARADAAYQWSTEDM